MLWKYWRKWRIPRLLLMNNVKLTQREYRAVEQQTEIERQWYGGQPVFDPPAIAAAAKAGKLVKVEETANYLPILRFRNLDLEEKYPPYLSKPAKRLLDEMGRNWRKQAQAAGVDGAIRLSVTSLTRSQEYQQIMREAGKLAMADSPHTRGEAFDIDGAAYYQGKSPVNPRAGKQSRWERAFAKLDARLAAPQFLDYSQYDPRVHTILSEVLAAMAAQAKLNYVLEYPGTTNACFHVCRQPDYK